MSQAKKEANDDSMIFDLTSPNKKNPMSYELESVIALLKIIQGNIVLLDPIDQEAQKTTPVAAFKKSIVDKLKALESQVENGNLKQVLDQDIAYDLVDILQKQFIDALINIKSYNEDKTLRVEYYNKFETCLNMYVGTNKDILLGKLNSINHILDVF